MLDSSPAEEEVGARKGKADPQVKMKMGLMKSQSAANVNTKNIRLCSTQQRAENPFSRVGRIHAQQTSPLHTEYDVYDMGYSCEPVQVSCPG